MSVRRINGTRAHITLTRSNYMILRVLDNSNNTVSKPQRETQLITAKYDPTKHTTTVCFDADVVTLGIVANFLAAEYAKKRSTLPTDVIEQLDHAISRTLNTLDIERGR